MCEQASEVLQSGSRSQGQTGRNKSKNPRREPMKEPELRTAFYSRIPPGYADGSKGRVFEEMILGYGRGRIDIVMADTHVHGIELKSAADSLYRLEQQQAIYSEYFEKMTLVVDERHCDEAARIVPSWWGLIRVHQAKTGRVSFKRLRRSLNNPSVNSYRLVTLLWDCEIIAVLDEMDRAKGYRSKPLYILWHTLHSILTEQEIRRIVRRKLRERPDWLAAPLNRLCA